VNKNIIILIMAHLIALPLISCASQSLRVEDHVIHINPSLSFDEAATALPVNHEQALKLALRHRETQRPDIAKHAIGRLAGIVDGFYVFSLPQKDGIPLSGIYVNGNSGIVEDRIFPFKIVNGKVVKETAR